jgi:hypothetical protein
MHIARMQFLAAASSMRSGARSTTSPLPGSARMAWHTRVAAAMSVARTLRGIARCWIRRGRVPHRHGTLR